MDQSTAQEAWSFINVLTLSIIAFIRLYRMRKYMAILHIEDGI